MNAAASTERTGHAPLEIMEIQIFVHSQIVPCAQLSERLTGWISLVRTSLGQSVQEGEGDNISRLFQMIIYHLVGLAAGSIRRQHLPSTTLLAELISIPDFFRCNDYSQNVGIASPYKALLLNKVKILLICEPLFLASRRRKVVVGKTQKLFKDSPSLTQPPTGFDSVCLFIHVLCKNLVLFLTSL